MLEIINLTCGYDSRFFLKEINLKVEQREFIGIIGPNGSGKTTLLRAITKVIQPKKGEILFEKENIEKLSFNALAKKIAVVTQSLEIGFNLNVEEFILLGRIPHLKKWQFLETRADKETVYKAMGLTDTLGFKDRSMESLSAGERQLVIIAKALAQEPKLLLMDEPTSHLDITHQVKILDLLKRLNRQNTLTIIVVLHDLNLASEYCDRLILLNNGFIHKMDSPYEVLTYQIIEEVYKTIVVVERNPVSSRPYILLVSEEERLQSQSKAERLLKKS